ncbi:MAG: hypothetical protein IKO55_08525, partial [Kiritimatiellae bacterium]|nr:hypothetical protein [Kiritimatiellia bacterium]
MINCRIYILPAALTLFFAAAPVSAFWYEAGREVANSGKEYPFHTTIVEGKGGRDQPLYRDSHSAAEQRKVFEMGQLAKDSYKSKGQSSIPDGYEAVTTGGGLNDVLGPNNLFKMCDDGSIEWNGPGSNDGFQAAIYKQEDCSLVLAF